MDERNWNDQYSQNDQNGQQNSGQDTYNQNGYGRDQGNPYYQNNTGNGQYGQYQDQNAGYNQGYNQYNQGNPYYQPPRKPGPNALSIIGLVLGILSIPAGCCFVWYSLVVAIPGLICSIIGYRQTRSGVALAGIICSIVGLVVCVIMIVLALIGFAFLNSMDPSEVNSLMESLGIEYYR